MSRLHPSAFDLLDAELQRCIHGSSAELAYQFAIARLQRLCDTAGPPAAAQELRKILIDLAPQISATALRQAAQLNTAQLNTAQCREATIGAARNGYRPIGLSRLRSRLRSVFDPFSFTWGSRLTWASLLSAVGLFAFPRSPVPLPGITAMNTTMNTAIAEMSLPRSGELIQTAKTFAAITQQSMQAKALSVQEWQRVIEQWQESIDLLQQVSPASPEHATAQQLIQQYQHQQAQAQQQLHAEKASATALQVAKARVRWFTPKASHMNRQEKAKAIHQIEQQLKPVIPDTTGYASGKVVLAEIKQKMR